MKKLSFQIRPSDVFLALYAAAFLFLFVVVAWNNRPAADDFYYLGTQSFEEIIRKVFDLWKGYSGRWAAYLFTGAVIHFFPQHPILLFIFQLASMLLLIWISALLFRRLLLTGSNIFLSPFKQVLYAIIFSSCFFFSAFQVSESWFWMVQFCTYQWSLFLTLALAVNLLNGHNRIADYFIIGGSAAFIGGASESFALVILLLLSAWYFISVFRVPFFYELPVNNSLHSKLFVAFIIMLASFLVVMLAPGNAIRYEALPHAGISDKGMIIFRVFARVMLKTIFKLPVLLVLASPFFFLGREFYKNETAVTFRKFFKNQAFHFLFYAAMVFILVLPATLVMSGLPPDRALGQISLLNTFFVCHLLFRAGRNLRYAGGNPQKLTTPLFLGIFAGMVFLGFRQNKITSAYARAYDSQMTMLLELQRSGNTQPVLLDPLPPSGFIFPSVLSGDPDHINNTLLRKGLQLDFPLVSK